VLVSPTDLKATLYTDVIFHSLLKQYMLPKMHRRVNWRQCFLISNHIAYMQLIDFLMEQRNRFYI